MKEFQIEKVEHEPIDKEHTCFLVSKSITSGNIKQLNFYNYHLALGLIGFGAVGIWRVKPTDK